MFNVLAAPLLNIADKILDRVIPDKEAREKAKLEFARQAANLSQEEVKEFHNFVVEYEGRGSDIHWSIQILRGSVRPILTYCLAAAYVWGFLHPGQFNAEAMTGLFQLNLISLGFWYGEKALKNLGLNLSKGK